MFTLIAFTATTASRPKFCVKLHDFLGDRVVEIGSVQDKTLVLLSLDAIEDVTFHANRFLKTMLTLDEQALVQRCTYL